MLLNYSLTKHTLAGLNALSVNVNYRSKLIIQGLYQYIGKSAEQDH